MRVISNTLAAVWEDSENGKHQFAIDVTGMLTVEIPYHDLYMAYGPQVGTDAIGHFMDDSELPKKTLPTGITRVAWVVKMVTGKPIQKAYVVDLAVLKFEYEPCEVDPPYDEGDGPMDFSLESLDQEC